MMRWMKTGWILGMLCVLGAGSALAQDTAKVKKELEAMNAKAIAAIKKKDAATLIGLLTPDFTFQGTKGEKMTRAQYEQTVKQQFTVVKEVKAASAKVGAVTVKGNTAVAQLSSQLTLTVADPQGKLHTIMQSSTSEDTMVKTAQGWKLKKTVEKTTSTTMDGLKMP